MAQLVTRSVEIDCERSNVVVKSNDIVQKSRFSLSVQEQKMILFLISKIKPDDSDFQEYTFSLKELCEVLGISYNGKNYRDFRQAIQSLADKSFWVDSESGSILCRWIAKAKIGTDLTVRIRLDDDLKPYLLALYNQFTTYELEYILTMRSKYSIRLYELLKSYSNLGRYDTTVDELKQLLLTPKYPVYKDFRLRVIDPALDEINMYTDLQVDFEPGRTGRRITHLHFFIQEKSDANLSHASDARNKILNKFRNTYKL